MVIQFIFYMAIVLILHLYIYCVVRKHGALGKYDEKQLHQYTPMVGPTLYLTPGTVFPVPVKLAISIENITPSIILPTWYWYLVHQ